MLYGNSLRGTLTILLLLMINLFPTKTLGCNQGELDAFQHLMEQLLTKIASTDAAKVKAASGDHTSVSLTLDLCGLQLMDELGTTSNLALTHTLLGDSPELTPTSLNQIFLLIDSNSSALSSIVTEADRLFNPSKSYIFILGNPDMTFAKNISFSSVLGRAKTLVFVWPSGDGRWLFLTPNRHTPKPAPRHEELEITDVLKMDETFKHDFYPYPPPVENLQGREVRITGIQYEPHVAQKTLPDGSTEFYGFEAKMIEALGAAANFRPAFRGTTDGLLWGEFDASTFSFNGLLGDLQFGRTDVGVANLYIRTDSAQFIDFTDSFNYDAYCFLVPMPKTNANWLILLEPMTFAVWMWFVASYLACILLLFLVTKVFGRDFSGLKYGNIVMDSIGWLFGEHTRSSNFVSRLKAVRVLIGPFMLGITVLIMGYSGNLISFLTIDVQPKLMETIDELVDVDTPIGNLLFSLNMTTQFLRSPNPRIRSLADKYKPYDTYDVGIASADKGDVIMIESKIFLNYLRSQMTDEFGKPKNYILDECWQSLYSVGFGLEKNSLFRRAVSAQILPVREAGLVDKWYRDQVGDVARIRMRELRRDEDGLSLDTMRVPFVFLVLCVGVSILGFLWEIGVDRWGKFRRKKQRQEKVFY